MGGRTVTSPSSLLSVDVVRAAGSSFIAGAMREALGNDAKGAPAIARLSSAFPFVSTFGISCVRGLRSQGRHIDISTADLQGSERILLLTDGHVRHKRHAQRMSQV